MLLNLLARFYLLKPRWTSSWYSAAIGSLLLFLCQSCDKKDASLFTRLESAKSGIDFENAIVETPEINILTYEYTYNGGGVAAGDFNNDGLCDLFFTGNTVSNRLYLNQGNLRFKDVTKNAGVGGRSFWKTGATVVDINNDGWLDIYVCYSGPDLKNNLSNELFINGGSSNGSTPVFSEQAATYGLDAPGTFSTQAAFFDYDRDGDLDMFLINHGVHFYSPFINTNKLRNERHPNFGNRLYRNDLVVDSTKQSSQKRFFNEVSKEAGIHGGGLNFSLGVSVGDVNGDGWPDIYVTNDYEEQDYFYLNNRDGTFTDATKKSFGHLSRNGMGTDLADFNNDGKLDLIEVDMWSEDNFRQKLLRGPDDYQRYQLMLDSGFHHQQMRNTLQVNNGVGPDGFPLFSEIGQLANVSSTDWSWAPLWVDVDNDGYKDLFVTNGYLRDFTSMDFLKYTVEDEKQKAQKEGKELELYKLISQMSSTKTSDYLFQNNGDLTFTDRSKEWGIYQPNLSFGATYADLDNDGDVELITNNTNEHATIWENHASDQLNKNFLKIKLKGPENNRIGVGARVEIQTGDRTQVQELMITRGYQSAVDAMLLFGLGDQKKIDQVRVTWPDGKISILENQISNQLLEIDYGRSIVDLSKSAAVAKPYFEDVTKELNIDFVHRENSFVDFDREPLLPYRLSMSGPPLAVADVNGDGDDDFYVGGASGQSGELYVSNSKNRFDKSIQRPWQIDAAKEDVAATFFDVDGDGDQDLFVVSGGNEFENGTTEQEDRLYINNGNGDFQKAPAGSTPVDHVSGSCVVAGDYDRDGDLDLFVGSSSLPGKFPLPSPGAILRNELDPSTGKFKLIVATKEVNPDLRELGMVRDALWTDINKDGWLDLMVVGHWMPIRIFYNNTKGKLIESKNETLSKSGGLWNRVIAADIDNDGDVDFVIGNEGLNLPWKASEVHPITLSVDDFNGDGKIDPIISSFNGSDSYPIASRDELLAQLNPLRKVYGDYASYGRATSAEIFSKLGSENPRQLSIHTLASSYMENLGDERFALSPLPMATQISSVNSLVVDDFTDDGKPDLLVAGNNYAYRSQFGNLDAGTGKLLTRNPIGHFEELAQTTNGLWLTGDIRTIGTLKRKGGRDYFLIGRNNSSLRVVRQTDAQTSGSSKK